MRTERDLDVSTGPLARLRTADGTVVGAGFLIGERHVMTCAHVVDDALERTRGTRAQPTKQILLDLPFLERSALKARVVAWHPLRELGALAQHPVSDAAVLELPEPVQGGVDSRNARLSSPPSGTDFVTFGFPEGLDNGAGAEGELLMTDAGGWRHVRDTQDRGYFIQPGFSGAPVFERGTRQLLGMVTAADQDATRRLAFVIPTLTLGRAWPLLARPYKGLFAFTEDDQGIFFGRDAFVDELAAKVAERAVVTVIGPSGSGKSSVVMAGLLPRLRAQGGWATTTCRPGQRPLYRLAHAIEELTAAGSDTAGSVARRATELEELLRQDPARIVEHADTLRGRRPGAERVLLVIDQLEELFTHDDGQPGGEAAASERSARQREFVDVLDAIARQRGRTLPIRAIATLRADFTGRALEDRALADLLREADVKLGPMTPGELAQVVEAPAARFGVSFEAGLVMEVVTAMAGQPGSLPLLQFALDRLWRRQTNRCLTRQAYVEIGQVEGALAEHAEAVIAGLTAAEQAAARRVLTRLVRLATPGEQAEDTRAVVSRAEIGEADWPVVRTLADERLVTTGRDPATGAETVEVVHEALIRSWPTLRTWLDADRAFGLWRQRLRSNVYGWRGEGDDGLLRGRLLAVAQGWLASHGEALNERERGFIEASEDKRQREQEKEEQRQAERVAMLEDHAKAQEASFKRLRRSVGWLVGALAAFILALGGTIYFAVEQGRAERRAAAERDAAEAAATEAKSRQLSAEADGLLRDAGGAEAAERAAALAIEGWRRHPTSTAYQVAATSLRELPLARIEHGASVWNLQFSPDSTLLVTSGSDGTVRFLDARTGAEIERLRQGDGDNALAFSPNGERLAVGSHNGSVRLLNASTRAEIARFQHDEGVVRSAFSPDGARLATGGQDGLVRIVDAITGVEVASIETGVAVERLTFSPDGARLATADWSGIIRLLDAAAGTEVAHVEHGEGVTRFAFSPDGARLATAGEDGLVRLLGTLTGGEVARFQHGDPGPSVAFSPDGARLATGGQDGLVRIVDAITGVEVASTETGVAVERLTFSPDGTLLAISGETSGGDGIIRLLDGAGTEIGQFEAPYGAEGYGYDAALLAFSPDGARMVLEVGSTIEVLDTDTRGELGRAEFGGGIQALAFSPDGARLVLGSVDGTARLLDVATGAELARMMHDNGVLDAAFSTDGTRLATASADGAVRLFDTVIETEIAHIGRGSGVDALTFDGEGARLAVGGADLTVRLLDAATGTEVAHVMTEDPASVLASSPDGPRLAIVSRDDVTGSSRILDAVTEAEIVQLASVDVWSAVAFSPDGSRLIGRGGNEARLFDVATGSEIASFGHTASNTVVLYDVAVSANGARVALGYGTESAEGSAVYVLDATDLTEIQSVQMTGYFTALAISPDGTRLAIGDEDGTARIVDASTFAEIARVVHGAPVRTLAFSPDGTRLASGDGNGTARVFDAATLSEIVRMEQGYAVTAIAFSPDGARLFTGNDDGSIQFLDVDPAIVFDRLCTERAGRNLTRAEWRQYLGEDEPWQPTCPGWRTVAE